MNITVVRDVETFGALKDEWNALLENSSNNILFLRWEWMFHYYSSMCNGQELFLLLVRDAEDQLRGIAPFVLREERIITKRTFLEFIGQRCSYYLRPISCDNDRHSVYDEIARYLFENKRRWDLIDFTHLADDSLFKARLKEHAKGHYCYWRDCITDPCKSIPLQASYDEYMSCLDKRFSKKLRYYLRSMNRDFDVEMCLPGDSESLDVYWEKFLELHMERVESKKSWTVLSSKEFQEFYSAIAHVAYQEGTLWLTGLKLDKEIAAVLFGIVWNGTFYFLNIGYRERAKYSLGLVLPLLCIERSIECDLERFDFLGGGGQYKEKMGGVSKGGLHIQVIKPVALLERSARKTAGKIVRKVGRSA